ncbi:unnamed protein product, partial [Symbiodinium sp. CCMP2592]
IERGQCFLVMFPASSSEDEQDTVRHPAAQCPDREQASEPQARVNAAAQAPQAGPRPRPLKKAGLSKAWDAKDAILRSSLAESAERQSFKELLGKIQKEENIEARLFVWERLYDETPTYCSQGYLQEDTGEIVYIPETGKIMASKLRWGMCLYLKPGFREDLPRYHLVHGTLTSPLVAMENQQGPIVRKTIMDTMSWSAEEARMLEVFKMQIVLRHTDLHRSALAAERSLEVDTGVPSTLLRCCLHRYRTSEQNALSVDPATESFLINATLAFRQKAGFTRLARDRVMKFALQKCRVYAGEPPAEVKRWRAQMASVLWPHAPKTKAEARRKFLWDYVLNGDVRLGSELQHYCIGPDCCPNGTESLRFKLRQAYGLEALFSPPPINFPRRSWQGQHASSAHMLQLFCCHGLLLHVPFESDVQEYLHRSDSLQNLYVAVLTLTRTDELKRAAVDRCGNDYEHQQMCRELPRPHDKSTPEHAVYPAQTAFRALDLHRLLQSSSEDFCQGPEVLSELFPESKSMPLELLLYRMTTRLQGSLYSLGIIEQRVYPYAFLEILASAAAAGEIAEDASISKDLFDSFGRLMLAAYPRAFRQ